MDGLDEDKVKEAQRHVEDVRWAAVITQEFVIDPDKPRIWTDGSRRFVEIGTLH